MPFFRRKKQEEIVGLEEEECNLRDMFGDSPGDGLSAPMDSTSSSDFVSEEDTSDTTSSGGEGIETAEPVLNDEAQQVMNDNLELMREVVLKIREDEEYAKSIYAHCPRLQALLNDHPDLRPLFEDPKFVVLNFEKVYRDAGGTLPGDEDANKPGTIQKIKAVLGKITSHPLFKVFKILMLIKKIVFFFSPTKFIGMAKNFVWPSLDDFELDADGLDPEDPEYEAQKTKLSLNNAADALEDPEVQDQMQEAMDDPDKMDEMIENNKELRELRDSNPVCAEMMNDPETLKIISDPDNLRALSEAPDLISEDFANPDAFLDMLENVEVEGDMDVDADFDADVDAEAEVEAEMDDDAEYSDEYSEEEYSEEEEDDYEGGDDFLDEVEYERDDDDGRERERSRSKSRSSKQRGASQQKQRDAEKDGEGGGGRFGFVSTLMEAGVGIMAGDMEGIGDIFGGGEDMEFEGGEFEGGEDFEGGDEGMLEGIEEVEEDEDGLLAQAEEKLEDVEETEKDENELLAQAEEKLEEVEETEKDENELLAQAEEKLEDVEETEKDENELLAQAEENLEDVEETEKERDESTHASEEQDMYAAMEEMDEGAAGQGADFADEFDAEEGDKNKNKDKEQEEREARDQAARGGGFYGEFEDDDGGGEGGGFSSGFQSEDPDDDWIRY